MEKKDQQKENRDINITTCSTSNTLTDYSHDQKMRLGFENTFAPTTVVRIVFSPNFDFIICTDP